MPELLAAYGFLHHQPPLGQMEDRPRRVPEAVTGTGRLPGSLEHLVAVVIPIIAVDLTIELTSLRCTPRFPVQHQVIMQRTGPARLIVQHLVSQPLRLPTVLTTRT